MQIRQFIEQHQLKTLSIVGSDLHGYPRGKKFLAKKFLDSPHAAMHLSNVFTMLDYGNFPIEPPVESDYWWPGWSDGYRDTRSVLDLDTARVVPWQDRTGLVICDFEHVDGGASLEFLPRAVLRNLLDRYQSLDLTPRVALETEFTIFHNPGPAHGGEYRGLQPLWDTPQAYVLTTLGKQENVLTPIIEYLQNFGIEVETWHAEAGAGQLEINLQANNALLAADHGFLLKHAVKEICSAMKLTASFMAKIDSQSFGNGSHVNVSLWQGPRNLFYDTSSENQLSQLMRWFIGGILSSLAEFTLLYAPTPNSYQRFVPYDWTGMRIAWGEDNKTASVRAVAENPASTRIEQRTGGADANPYLLVAATLAAGLYGIDQKIEPPLPVTGDCYVHKLLRNVPTNIDHAISLFEQSTVAKHYLGETFVRFYTHTRRAEAEAFKLACPIGSDNENVSTWELQRYFELV